MKSNATIRNIREGMQSQLILEGLKRKRVRRTPQRGPCISLSLFERARWPFLMLPANIFTNTRPNLLFCAVRDPGTSCQGKYMPQFDVAITGDVNLAPKVEF